MTDPLQSNPDWQAALRAAREDAPRTEARVDMWRNIEDACVGLASASAAEAVSGAREASGAGKTVSVGVRAAAASSMKGAFVGAVLGSAVSAVVVISLLKGAPLGRGAKADAAALDRRTEATVAADPAPPAATNGAIPSMTLPPVSPVAENAGTGSNAAANSLPQGAPAAHDHAPAATGDPLSREVRLLMDAREAIARGEPALALAKLQATRFMRSRQLAPEALALEARALRALGRGEDADAVEAQAKARGAAQ